MKRILICVLALLLGGTTFAQYTSKDINNIKRNSQYLYAESTMDTEEEARDVAFELLMRQVEEYVSSKTKLSNADNVLIKDIKSKGETMTMMRGTMHRVFVYVKKSDIEGVTNTTVLNTGSGARISVSDNQATVETAPYMNNAPKSPTTADNTSVTETPTRETQAYPTPHDEESSDRSAATNVPKEKVASPLSGWKKQAIEDLLACEDINAVRARLNRLKAEYKVKNYGTPDRCPSVEKAFWVLFDNNNRVITILGDGATQRIDYRSMTMSSLDEYKGYSAIWFNLSK